VRRHEAQPRGFTLIELVCVLFIITIMMAMAAPSLRGWARGNTLRLAADEFLSTCSAGRSLAVSEAIICRIAPTQQGDGYQLYRLVDGELQTLSGVHGLPHTLPIGISLSVTFPAGASTGGIDFFPTARSTPSVVTIQDSQGKSVQIECETPASLFHIKEQS
jgi:prepilin-type N-terminal cleavage/methylation domain-containing protein